MANILYFSTEITLVISVIKHITYVLHCYIVILLNTAFQNNNFMHFFEIKKNNNKNKQVKFRFFQNCV